MTNSVTPLRQAARLGSWNDIVGSEFRGCVVDAEAQRFAGTLVACEVDNLRFVKIKAQSSKVRRWLNDVPSSRSGSALLHLQRTGTGINRQGRWETRIDAGDGVLCDPDRPYGIDFVTPYEMFVLEVPLTQIYLRQPGFDVEQAAGQPIDANRSRLLLAFIQAAWAQLDCLADDADWRECVSRVALDLALRALGQSVEASGVSAELRRLVIDYIRAHSADPALRTSAIAKALQVSPRSVQSVFERMSTTASAFIMDQRLRWAAERLRNERGRVSITQIAYDCGFSDSAYFSRCFHKAYGVAPRLYLKS
jgi:AraC-like DNA-binding protein